MPYPFQSPKLPLEERIDNLLSQMTLEEKLSWIPTDQAAVDRLGIPAYQIGGEGAHGFVDRDGPSTTFPQTQGLASTWDGDLLERIGGIIGKEARSWYNSHDKSGGLSLWFPTIDMEKDPRWGRTEEAYGEDPYLAGKLSSRMIQGAQGKDKHYLQISCAPKHFIANNNEKNRLSCSCSVDPRNLQEYYLSPFRRAFTEGKAFSMMTSYNEVNGIPMMLHPMVRDIVKKEWGLDRGHVVTDGGDFLHTVDRHHYFDSHAETLAAAFRNGIDTMTDKAEVVIEAAREALEKGLITEEIIDAHLKQTLKVRFRFGQFDPEGACPYDAIGPEAFMNEAYRRTAREAVQKSLVLLKNQNDLLPLKPENDKVIGVCGPLADVNYLDWYTGTPSYAVSPLDGLKAALPQCEIRHIEHRDQVCFHTASGLPLILKGEENILTAGSKQDEAALFLLEDWGWGACVLYSAEKGKYLNTRASLADHQPSDEEIARMKDEQIPRPLAADRETCLNWFVTTLFSLIPQEDGCCLIRSWNGPLLHASGEDKALQLSETLVPGTKENFVMTLMQNGLEQAAKEAAQCDVNLLFLGNNPVINGKEEMDRPDISLPPNQETLALAVHESQPRCAAVMISSYPLAISPLKDRIPALLYGAHGMQELGNGLADVLCGRISPAGRLSMTWYPSVDALPPMMEYDIIRSDNTYQYYQGDVLYPFGYGLSYSTFEYTDLSLDRKQLKEGDVLNIRFTLKNTGKMESDEVPQLYIRIIGSRVKRPIRSLKGFCRVSIKPGKRKDIHFTLPAEELMFWDVTRNCFCLEEGYCQIQLGSSSTNIILEEVIDIKGEMVPPRDLSSWTMAWNYDSYRNAYLHEKRGDDIPAVFTSMGGKECWLLFSTVNLDKGCRSFEAIISAGPAAVLEIHTETPDGPLLGSLNLPNTGDICAVPGKKLKAQWASISTVLEPLRGIHDLYIVLRGEAAIHRFRIKE